MCEPRKSNYRPVHFYLEHIQLRLLIQSCVEGRCSEKESGNSSQREQIQITCLLRRDLPEILPVRSNADLRPLTVCTISSGQAFIKSRSGI